MSNYFLKKLLTLRLLFFRTISRRYEDGDVNIASEIARENNVAVDFSQRHREKRTDSFF